MLTGVDISSSKLSGTFSTGNRNLLPSIKGMRSNEAAEGSESGSLIVYNGAMVDVGSMMQKLDKSEKAREEIEQKLMLQDTKIGEAIFHWRFKLCRGQFAFPFQDERR